MQVQGAKDIIRQLRDDPLFDQLAAEGQARLLGRSAPASAHRTQQAQQAQRSRVAAPSSSTAPAKRPRQHLQAPPGKVPAKVAARGFLGTGGGGKRAAAAAAVSKSPRGAAAAPPDVAAPPAKRRRGQGRRTGVAGRGTIAAGGKRRGPEAVGHGVRVFWSMDSEW